MKPLVSTIICALVVWTQPAHANPSPIISVRPIPSQVSCNLLVSWWGYWIDHECREDFPDLKAAVESALLEGGHVSIKDSEIGNGSEGSYILIGRVLGLGAKTKTGRGPEYCLADTAISGELDIKIVDAHTGRARFGSIVRKSVPLAERIADTEHNCHVPQAGRASYDALQAELARAAARLVTFDLDPMRVLRVDGKRVVLSYGRPLVSLGAIVKIADDRGYPIRYRVSGVIGNSAVADPMGDVGHIAPGALAEYVESDDPDANGRRFNKVELP